MTPASRCRLSIEPPPRVLPEDDVWTRIAKLRLITGGLGKPLPVEVDDPGKDDDPDADYGEPEGAASAPEDGPPVVT
jgi:hypothetical protein